jgi:hypothetical protein
MQKNAQNATKIYSESTARSKQKMTKRKMTQVHLILQGKGGIGKSVVAYLIAQYLDSVGKPMVAIDIDPVNATLTGYKGLNVKRLQVIKDEAIVERNFDEMMEDILKDENSNYVIDNGASSFVTFTRYLLRNDIIDVLSENGKEVFVHTVIKAGQDLRITVAGFGSIAEQMPENAKIVVWLNEFSGEITHEGKTFEQMKVYQKNKNRVHGIVKVDPQAGTMYGSDMKQMLDAWLTFEEVSKSPDFSIMTKSRLSKVKKSIFDQIERAVQ